MARKVVLSLTGDLISVQDFLTAAEDLHGLLQEVDRAISGKTTLDWVIVGMRGSSAILETAPRKITEDEPDRGEEVIKAALDGIQKIEKSPIRPLHFTDGALERARALSRVVMAGNIDQIRIQGSTNGKRIPQVTVTQRIAANIDELIGPRYSAIGSVEGTLEVVSIHGGYSFNVYDLLTGLKVRCICEEQTLADLTSKLGKRVLVHGQIRSSAKGQPLSIKVERVRVLRDRSDLPQVDDIQGLMNQSENEREKLGEYLRS
jgi:hypothetical protein